MQSESQPPYVVIAGDLRRKILDGTFGPGERLATAKVFAKEYGAAIMTVQNAIRLLREEGLVITQQGRGIFVSANPGESADQRPSAEFAAVMSSLDKVIAELGRLDGRVRELEQTVDALQSGD
ncbi:GntR family transcriptional regulator [Streptacidiphilus cavernicola]|uniref:GntR family transcriptional regulator n=1 Tax=Streptacidiphilus cavernicola TaxID=3342716 RepID=A0ABV6VS30_9ACTN